MGAAKIKAPKTIFLPSQIRWIKDKSRMKIAEKARQIGFTWCSAYADAVTVGAAGNKHDLWITSRDELQAKLYVDDCKKWSDVLNIAAHEVGERLIDDSKGAKTSAFTLPFASGKTIYSLSSNFNAQAGKRGHRRADEFALNEHNRMLYDVLKPGTQWGGSIWIWSTHRGSQNYFNSLIKEIREGGNPKKFSLHSITLEDALNEGLLDKLQAKWDADDERQEWDETDFYNDCKNGMSSEEMFRQEYMCEPSDDKSAYISYDLLDKSYYQGTINWEADINLESTYYLGMDIARTTDLTVIFVVEKLGDMLLTRRIIELKKTSFSEQERILDTYAQMPSVKRVCIDASGLGKQLAEQARERHGSKVEEVVFTPAVKEDLAVTTRRTMEDGKLRIPRSDALEADIRSIRKETTSAGNVRYTGERTSNGHADRFWALALALHAAKDLGYTFAPEPVYRFGIGGDGASFNTGNNINLTSRPF